MSLRVPATTIELLQRSLWLAGQVPRLQEISEQMGVASHVTDVTNVTGALWAAKIVEAANRLNADLSLYLAASTPEPEPAAVLRLKYYRNCAEVL